LVELLLVATKPPSLVVAVLPPSRGVGADRLQVPARIGADPHVRPRRRDREHANALERLRVVDAPARGVDLLEAASTALAGDPRRAGVCAAKTAHGWRNGSDAAAVSLQPSAMSTSRSPRRRGRRPSPSPPSPRRPSPRHRRDGRPRPPAAAEPGAGPSVAARRPGRRPAAPSPGRAT